MSILKKLTISLKLNSITENEIVYGLIKHMSMNDLLSKKIN